MLVTLKDVQTLSSVDIPYPAGRIVAAADGLVTADLDAADAVLVSGQQPELRTLLDVPDSQSCVS